MLMTAVGTHPQTDLLQRVAECYRNALSNWFPERILMAVEFLYIAAERPGEAKKKTAEEEE